MTGCIIACDQNDQNACDMPSCIMSFISDKKGQNQTNVAPTLLITLLAHTHIDFIKPSQGQLEAIDCLAVAWDVILRQCRIWGRNRSTMTSHSTTTAATSKHGKTHPSNLSICFWLVMFLKFRQVCFLYSWHLSLCLITLRAYNLLHKILINFDGLCDSAAKEIYHAL